VLELLGITKSYPGVKALDGVSYRFTQDGINALVGENGAGKSTLIKIISGIEKQDAGHILLNGEKLVVNNFIEGLKKGISIVSQELQVIAHASIAENIMLDKMATLGRTGLIDWRSIHQTAQKYIGMVGLNLPSSTIVGKLGASQKQLVEIAKALSSDAKILLLDEPTSSISEKEARKLFDILRDLKRKKDMIVIFVTHKLDEVFAVCSNVSVLRDGRGLGTYRIDELDKHRLIRLMIGREESAGALKEIEADRSNKALEVKNLTKKGQIEDASFTLYKGEILGFYGLVGSGRTELAKALIGETRKDRGEIYINGRKANIRYVGDTLYKYKLGYVTENRREEGLLLNKPVKTNICVTIWKQIAATVLGWISGKSEKKIANQMIKDLDIKVTGIDQVVKKLSGGNQQKVSIAKWLASDCEILIFDEPTVGVDVGAKEYIHELIHALAEKKHKSIIIISSEMPEVIKLSGRILVFKDRRIVGEVETRGNGDNSYRELSQEIGKYYL
jgi:ribose transport system ATP-binding protein